MMMILFCVLSTLPYISAMITNLKISNTEIYDPNGALYEFTDRGPACFVTAWLLSFVLRFLSLFPW